MGSRLGALAARERWRLQRPALVRVRGGLVINPGRRRADLARPELWVELCYFVQKGGTTSLEVQFTSLSLKDSS